MSERLQREHDPVDPALVDAPLNTAQLTAAQRATTPRTTASHSNDRHSSERRAEPGQPIAANPTQTAADVVRRAMTSSPGPGTDAAGRAQRAATSKATTDTELPASPSAHGQGRIQRAALPNESTIAGAARDAPNLAPRIRRSPNGPLVIRRLTTGDLEKRVVYMTKGITHILSQPESAGLSEAHQQLVREKFIAATRTNFSARGGKGKDKDADYQDVVADAKAKIAAIKNATTQLDRAVLQGGDFSPAVSSAQTALGKAITDYGDQIGPATDTLEDALDGLGSSLRTRMESAKESAGGYNDFAAVKDQTLQYKKALKELEAAIAAAKKTDVGIGNPQLNAMTTAGGKLTTMLEIDKWSAELSTTYKGPSHGLKASLADGVHKIRHKDPLGRTKEAMEQKYKAALARWQLTPEGNNASTVVPAETKDVSAVSARLEHHVFVGNINSQGQATGVHHKDALGTKVKLVGARTELGKGFYRSSIEIKNASDDWVAKRAQSTFFPDGWSKKQVKEQITRAWNNPSKTFDGSKWTSLIDGLTYKGYYEGGDKPTAAWVEFP